ncbi:MAG TPA: copper-binding protein [Alicycliphilus sp.]|nr:copper-binding protein [Alicycliphilus sp.]
MPTHFQRLLGGAAALVMAASAAAQAPTTAGEVVKLDKPGNRVTIKHGEIKNLDMPAMTMAFRVREPKLLDGLAVGDKVRFVVQRIDGQYTVTALTKAP